MDAFRKQLDALMGASRNGDVLEVMRNYWDRDVCRLYLTTLCLHDLFQLMLDQNVFFSGSGGTGKTLLLQQILKFFKLRYYKNHSSYDHMGHACECFACNVAVTTPTRIATIPIGGSTLHRAAGISIPHRPRDFNRMWYKPVRSKWRNLNVLIVDEISMVRAEMVEYLEQTISRIRTFNKDDQTVRPFGGLQVIFASEFFQLHPVEDRDYRTCSDHFLNRGLAYEAPAWDRAKLKTVILSLVFRQGCRNMIHPNCVSQRLTKL